MSRIQLNKNRTLLPFDKGMAFLVLAAPFYFNDFGFVIWNGTYSVYLVDYATRICPEIPAF